MSQYDVISKSYDILDRKWFEEEGVNPRTVIKEAIPNIECDVLDMCCGTFSNGFSVALKNPNNRICGIDLSASMISEAKKKITDAGLSNVKLKCIDATNTRMESESFDYIIIGLVLHECSPRLRERILAEAHRLLKREGTLIVLEWEKQKSLKRKLKYAPIYLGEVLGSFTFKQFYLCDKEKYFTEQGFYVSKMTHCNYTLVLEMKAV